MPTEPDTRRKAEAGSVGGGFVRHLGDADLMPVDMPGVEGVRMAVMVGRQDGAPTFALRQFVVAPGGHSPRHSHDYEHEVFVVSGTGDVLLGERRHALRAGDVVFVPAGLEHQFRAGDSGMTFLCLVPVQRQCGEPTPGS